MFKVLLIALILVLPAVPSVLAAEKAPKKDTAEISAIDLKIKRSLELMKAARRVADESDSPEASALMDDAEASSKAASEFFKAGDYDSARKAIFSSIQTAVSAIVAAKGHGAGGMREMAMKDESVERAVRDQDKKEARLEKLASEVETFIKVAERLSGQPDANASIADARKLYASSLERSAEGDHDGALSEMKTAYRLATSGVRELKRSRGEVITFPPPSPSDPNELLAHELKKNDTYAIFSLQLINEEEGAPKSKLKEAFAAREDAMKSMRSGNSEKALERIRKSTELYIDAIKAAGR